MVKSRTIGSLILGVSHGLTVPFALATGLSELLDDSNIVLLSGAMQLIAGSISIGLGGYLSVKLEGETPAAELKRQYRQIEEHPDQEGLEIRGILAEHGLVGNNLEQAEKMLTSTRQLWAMFLVTQQIGLNPIPLKGATVAGFIVACGYMLSGTISLLPYLIDRDINQALIKSIGLTTFALIVFGIFKAKTLKTNYVKSVFEVLMVSAIAAGACYISARTLVSG